MTCLAISRALADSLTRSTFCSTQSHLFGPIMVRARAVCSGRERHRQSAAQLGLSSGGLTPPALSVGVRRAAVRSTLPCPYLVDRIASLGLAGDIHDHGHLLPAAHERPPTPRENAHRIASPGYADPALLQPHRGHRCWQSRWR
jgi:hypothetical protein